MAAATWLGRRLPFFTFPVIAAALKPLDFGTFDLIATTIGLVGLFINCGLNNAVQRYYWNKDVAADMRASLLTRPADGLG